MDLTEFAFEVNEMDFTEGETSYLVYPNGLNQIIPLETAHDVYELIGHELAPWVLGEMGMVAFVSHGWASPINELPPSIHPEKKRVRLTLAVNKNADAVTICQLEGEEPMWEDGVNSEGSLMDAVMSLVAYVKENGL